MIAGAIASTSEIDKLKTCVHEAAHAIAARQFGIELIWVSYDAAFIRSNPDAIEAGCAGGGPVCLARAPAEFLRTAARGRITTKEELDVVTQRGVQLMVGPLAERHFYPDCWHPSTMAGDEKELFDLLSAVSSKNGEGIRLLNSIFKQAQKWVRRDAFGVRNLASHLLVRKTIHGDEIDALIELSGSSSAGAL